MRCRPVLEKAYVKAARRGWLADLYRLTVATALPSTEIRAEPRVGPRGAIQATWLPMKLNVAVLPRVPADRIFPPRWTDEELDFQVPE
jgi:hypothetical protein